MMPYKDEEVQNMDLAELKVEMPDQGEAPTLEEEDYFLVMEVLIPRGYVYQQVTVALGKQSADGKHIVSRNSNPILDTKIYKEVFPYREGIIESSSRVDDSILNSCESEGNKIIMFRDI